MSEIRGDASYGSCLMLVSHMSGKEIEQQKRVLNQALEQIGDRSPGSGLLQSRLKELEEGKVSYF